MQFRTLPTSPSSSMASGGRLRAALTVWTVVGAVAWLTSAPRMASHEAQLVAS